MATARMAGIAPPPNCPRTSNTRGEAPTHLSQLFSVQMARALAIRLAGFFRIWEQKRVP